MKRRDASEAVKYWGVQQAVLKLVSRLILGDTAAPLLTNTLLTLEGGGVAGGGGGGARAEARGRDGEVGG